ncbi:MAG: hypothetical protein HOL55_09470 [Nitrospina sp.]|jgi:hypothetical protein|nr:hypothetical protein [Nitrospina sp.]
MNEITKVYRGYLKQTGFSDFPMHHQRQKILKKLEKKYWVEEKLTQRVSMQKQDAVCQDHRLDLITQLEKLHIEIPAPTLRNGIPDIKKPRILLYWYIDIMNRDGLREMIYDLSPDDIVLTMDFTLPDEILELPQFELIAEKRSKLPTLFNLIRDLLRQKFSLRGIADQIKSRLGVNMSHMTVKKIINENNLRFVN